ncbi:LysR family transcriptional regulator [Paraburkholderia sp. RP-4-7]|jgi:DNA-binding transcriptional LysR family regulator|uniref:LysR family transcriptional regulator n=1 Tax=Paraburkholderia polaris TaxID=2728848 RepID=A0A848IP16_9BURK|nr:LysR family transcriptional regulator [Paraburkholderia polaris]NMM01545.1 LysR family transcriptional regulator [Paraburkholderia polaris]
MSPELLRDVAVFVEVAKVQSFSKASIALNLPKSTVSRRIADFEHQAGLRLFTRSARKVALTQEGETFYQECRRLVEGANAAYEQLLSAKHRPHGLLRVAATLDFGLRMIAGLPNLCAQYPDLRLQFDFTTRKVDPFVDSFDVAIYIGVPPDSSLTARKLANLARGIYAAPCYLQAHAPIVKPADISLHHQCILQTRTHDVGVQTTWCLTNGAEHRDVEVRGALSLNSISVIRQLAIGGAGLALLPHSMCVDDVKSGRLARVLTEWNASAIPIYALTPSRVMPAKTRVFLDFVASIFEPSQTS